MSDLLPLILMSPAGPPPRVEVIHSSRQFALAFAFEPTPHEREPRIGRMSLEKVFEEFAGFGSSRSSNALVVIASKVLMDSRNCQKLANDCGLVDGKTLTKTDVDLIFAKCKTKGKTKITYEQFVECTRYWAVKKKMNHPDLLELILNAKGPTLNATTIPEYTKYHDDQDMYTGVYKRGGPSTSSGKVDLSNLLDRSPADVRGRKIDNAHHKLEPKSLHPDWYEVENPNSTCARDRIYYVNRYTNETTWTRPVVPEPPPPLQQQKQ